MQRRRAREGGTQVPPASWDPFLCVYPKIEKVLVYHTAFLEITPPPSCLNFSCLELEKYCTGPFCSLDLPIDLSMDLPLKSAEVYARVNLGETI